MARVNHLQLHCCLSLISLASVLHGSSLESVPENEEKEYHSVYRLLPTNRKQYQILEKLYLDDDENAGLNFWKAPKDVNYTVDVMVPTKYNETFLEMLQILDLSYEITIPDVKQLIMKNKRDAKIREAFAGPILRDSSDRRRRYYFQDYSTYMSKSGRLNMVDYMDEVEKAFPRIANVLTIGKTHENRPIRTMKIGSPYSDNRPSVWIDGGIHAREWAAPHTAIYFIEQLVSRYCKDPWAAHVIDNLNIFITPVVNPDGYEYTHTGDDTNVRLWRKNRSPSRCVRNRWGVNKCCRGVDLNRNFDFYWGGAGASLQPCSEIYAGTKAFSEPEARAVRDKVNALGSKLNAFVTMHTYSQIWVHPYGHKRNDYPADKSDLYSVGRKAAETLKKEFGTRYIVGSGADTLYPASGGSDDWAKDTAGIKYVYLLELRPDERHYDGFILPQSELLPTAKETWAGVKVVIDEVLKRNNREFKNTRGRARGAECATEASSERSSQKQDDNRRNASSKDTSATTKTSGGDDFECMDKRYACKVWVRQSNRRVCTSLRVFMSKQCPVSCNFCQPFKASRSRMVHTT